MNNYQNLEIIGNIIQNMRGFFSIFVFRILFWRQRKNCARYIRIEEDQMHTRGLYFLVYFIDFLFLWDFRKFLKKYLV